MRLRGSLGLLALTATLTACASSITPADGGEDGSVINDGNVLQDRVVPPADRVTPPVDVPTPTEDVVIPGEDVVEPPPMDVVIPGEDVVVPPMDSTVEDTGVPPTDSGVVTDTGVPPTDSGVGPACPAIGLNEDCPAMGSMGACAPLTAGTRTLVFQGSGLTAGIGASCEGAQTSMGPDGVIPLVITENSNVTIALNQLGSGAVTASLFSGTGCGVATQQRGCVNTSGGTNTLNASNLTPGTYWVQFSAAPAAMSTTLPAVTVTTTIVPAPPRVAGDTCPGVAVPSNGTPTTINSSMFMRAGTEVPTAMCPNIGSNLDAVFSFTITETSNVSLLVQGPTSISQMALDVQSSCGSSMAFRADVVCQQAAGASISRMVSRLAPGTYFGVVQARAGMTTPSPLLVTVTASPPTPTSDADRCPGQPISANTTFTSAVSSLAQNTTFSCFPASAADGNYSFNAPMGQDVLVEAVAGTNRVAVELQEPCGMNAMSCTAPTGTGRVWQRYSGLAGGRSYTLHAGTNAGSGNLDVTYRAIPALTTNAVMGNEACASASTIPATGGVFTGNTAMMAANSAAPTFGGGATCNGCNTAAGRDAVYRLTLTARTRVLAKLTGAAANFDPVIYVRQGMTCQDGMTGGAGAGILFCADDYYGQNSAFDRVLDPGTYHFFVDDCVPGGGGGGGARGGAYSLEVITLAP